VGALHPRWYRDHHPGGGLLDRRGHRLRGLRSARAPELEPVIFAVATLYVSLVRGTPLIVQILFIYLALPQIWSGFAEIPAIALGIFALAFNTGRT